MKYFVIEFNAYQARNIAWKDFLKKLADYKYTLLQDLVSVDQLVETIEGEMEDANTRHKACKLMECKVVKLTDGEILISVGIPSASLRPTVLAVRIVPVAHVWNNEKGGIR